MRSNAPSTKVIVPGIIGALATLTLALVQHKIIDPRVISVALSTVIQSALAYLIPHKPVRVKPPTIHRHRRHRPVFQEFTTMYDTTTPTALGRVVTTSADVVIAAYDDGRYNDVREMRRDYPGHHVYSIAVFAKDDADFIDCEPGNATPADVCAWVRHRRAVGAPFIGVYADATRWAEIFSEALAQGLSLAGVCKWIADPSGYPHIPAGYDGCQWGWPGRGTSANFDKSLFYSHALR